MRREAAWKVLRTLLGAGLVWAAIPASQAAAQRDARDGDERIVLSGPVVVRQGETVEDVIVFHGSADVAGTVDGDLIIFDGPAEVSGTVDGDVIAFKGPVTLRETADVKGDVVVSGTLNAMPGAQIAGETKQAQFSELPGRLELFGRVAAWIGFTVSILALGLLLLLLGPRVTEGLAQTGLASTLPALGWGLVAFFAIPIITLVSFFTIVGIPFGIMVLFGSLFLYPIGYIASGVVLGRKLISGPDKRVVSFLAGLAALRLVALVPVLGGFTWFLATAFGLGVIAMTILRARARPIEPQPVPAAAPSV